jgi:HlyD family secretion protein
MKHVRYGVPFLALAACLLTLTPGVWSQEEQPGAAAEPAAQTAPAEPAAQSAPAAGATHKVTQGAFKIEVDMSGVFESDQTWPVAIRPDSWSSFTVLKAVPHGKPVQQGESLVALDMQEIDQQLQDLQRSIRLNKLALQLADTELEMMKTTLPMDLEAAARAQKIADEELSYFLNINRSFLEESAKESLKSAQQSLEYAEEELKQLEKMYQADDLTEETEEIILRRARNDVERSKFYLKSAEQRSRRQLDQDIPRQEQQVTETAKRTGVSLEKTRLTLPVQFEKQQLEREKQVIEIQRLEEKLQQLTADRKQMAVESPAAGYVYYGRATRGKWPGVEAVASQLQEGGKLAPHNVFMTVVSPRPLHVRTDIQEKDLHRVARGMQGFAQPTGYPDMKLPVSVEQISPFPIGPNTFDGILRVTLDDKAKPIVPGMGCKLTLLAYENKAAITVPAAAVLENPVDGERNLVYVKNAEGKPEERKVVVGQKTEQKWEILEGLTAGEEIFLKKPNGP